jgi:RNB domain
LQASRDYAKYRHGTNLQQEGLLDLTKLPFVCVDAPRTTFRDDAISVRPRRPASGKTSVSYEACPWEILIAITDVSDVYIDQNNDMLDEESQLPICRKLLREGAANRGVSRYDLPLGPLHLMPQVALEALAFDAVPATTINDNNKDPKLHQAVVVWACIDETTGKVMDAGIERAMIANPIALSYQQASDLLEGNVDTSNDRRLHRTGQVLAVAERFLTAWDQQNRQTSDAAQKREERLALKEFVTQQQRQNLRDNDGFLRTRGHKLVDTSLNLYSYAAKALMRRAKAFLPQQAGSGQDRDGRVATAPLRRYVDGMAQRQILSVACGYGGPPMSKAECILVSQKATDSYNAISNIRSVRRDAPSMAFNKGSSQQKAAVRNLSMHLSGMVANIIIPAVTTGRGNEVVITGVGALAKCKGVNHAFKPGEKLQVQIHKMDVDSGNLSVTLVKEPPS